MDDLTLVRTVGYQNPELAKILASSGPVSSLNATTDIHALRQLLLQRKLAAAATPGNAAPASVTETDHRIATRDGATITVRVYHRASNPPGGPVLIMLHGGGWALGGLDNEAPLCRKWCSELHGVSINVDYRLAPEVKFPVPVHDCHDAVLWAAQHPEVHGGDLHKGFVLAGISAGANMACAVAHLARDAALVPALTGVYLSIPSLVSPEAVPARWAAEHTSRVENKDAPILNEGAMELFHSLYEDDPLSPLMSPLVWPSGHKQLPPTYLQVAGMDPIRDDGLLYERALREEAGVPTKIDLYPGLPHAFWSWWPTAEFSKKQLQDAVEGFRWLVASQSSS